MFDAAEAVGYLTVLLAAVSYGSYYVPIKRHEVHDGLVYQWYQCNGILLAGLAFALLRNDWSAPPGVSTGFYVAPEGLLSGMLFQLGNVAATLSVKSIGLGGYFTLHEVTNLGIALTVGFCGHYIGLPAKPPAHTEIALLGAISVSLGMVPVMFMKPAWGSTEEDPDSPPSISAVAERHAGGVVAEVSHSNLDALFAPPDSVAGGAQGPDYREVNTRTWDGVLGLPPNFRDSRRNMFGSGGMVPTVPPPLLELGISQGSEEPLLGGEEAQGPQAKGVCFALLAGALYSLMWLPQLRWEQRMMDAGHTAAAVDFAFAMCVGLGFSSTIWLVCGGAWKKFTGQRMEKSVLRPALFCGAMEFVGMACQMHALVALPYAVAYCSVTGGALAVSLAWGMFVFGEASGSRNRLLVGASFGGILLGIILLGISAQ